MRTVVLCALSLIVTNAVALPEIKDLDPIQKTFTENLKDVPISGTQLVGLLEIPSVTGSTHWSVYVRPPQFFNGRIDVKVTNAEGV